MFPGGRHHHNHGFAMINPNASLVLHHISPSWRGGKSRKQCNAEQSRPTDVGTNFISRSLRVTFLGASQKRLGQLDCGVCTEKYGRSEERRVGKECRSR